MSNRFAVLVVAVCALIVPEVALSAEPKNVIICIGDGMGSEHVKAARYYNGGELSFETLPYQGLQTTYSADNAVTESAASATSLATGVKVNNNVVSMAYPGDGADLETVLEYYRDRGRRTGLVTTTYVTEFTPGAFGAHVPYRYDSLGIAYDYLHQSRPNVLFGGGGHGMTSWGAEQAGYTVVTDAAELLALDADAETYVSGQFGISHMPAELDGVGSLPHLSEMTQVALDILDNDPDGFFMMMEGGRIDHAGHANLIEHDVFETLEFANSVQVVMDWAAGRTDTLVIVAADHETGGLTVEADNGAGNFPTVTWSTTDHTAADVPIYTWGLNARTVSGVMDNTEVYDLMVMSEPADFDDDGAVTTSDIDMLRDNMGGGSGTFDLNGDGLVDDGDLDYLLTDVLGTRVGDFNLDGLVDGTDLAIFKAGFGMSGQGYAQGNCNPDEFIDGTDLAILKSNFGLSGTGVLVPGPATLGMLSLGALRLVTVRRRR
jgi:alkaline phosphatase